MNQGALKLRAVTESQRDECEYIKTIAEGAGGRFTISRNSMSALHIALNRAAELNADSYYIVSSNSTILGSSIIIDVLKCQDIKVKPVKVKSQKTVENKSTLYLQLKDLNKLLAEGIINQEEYNNQKKKILDNN